MPAFDPTRPFTRAEALAAGMSDAQLRGPDFRSVLYGLYVHHSVPDTPLLRARAALAVHPEGAVATHFTAARVVGVPVPAHGFEHVTVPRPSDRRRRRGVRCHVAALAHEDVRVLDGVEISAPLRLFVELAAYLTLVDLVVVGDWLVRRGHVTTGSLVEHCAASADRHAAHAREAASYVRARVDSPMETRLRMLLVLAGLPEPSVNLVLRDHTGEIVMRLDLSYPGEKLAVEYDGRQHLESVSQWERDVDRREDLGDGGWRLIRVTSRGIYQRPEETVTRVWQALRERGHPRLPRPTDGWRPHFG